MTNITIEVTDGKCLREVVNTFFRSFGLKTIYVVGAVGFCKRVPMQGSLMKTPEQREFCILGFTGRFMGRNDFKVDEKYRLNVNLMDEAYGTILSGILAHDVELTRSVMVAKENVYVMENMARLTSNLTTAPEPSFHLLVEMLELPDLV